MKSKNLHLKETAMGQPQKSQEHWSWTYEGWNFNSGNSLFTTDTK
jgi:hypothetical protein